jgi:hypothetical protein
MTMTTAATAPVEQTHDTNGDEAPQWFRLRGIDWETYRAISDALTGRHVRLTYDRGTLEFMTISFAHGTLGRLMVLFVAAAT